MAFFGNVVKNATVFLKLQLLHIRAHAEYPVDLSIGVIGGLLRQLTGFVFIWAVLSRVPSIQGWSLWEIALLYSLFLIPRGLLELFFEGQAKLRILVYRGNFDWLLVRPISTSLLLITQQSNIHGIGTFILGILILSRASTEIGLSWSLFAIVYLIAVIISSTMLLVSVSFAANCVAFWDPGANSSFPFLLNNLTEFVKFPITIYNFALQFLLTFIIPIAFVSYFPGLVLLNKVQGIPWEGYISVLVGPVAVGITSLIWRQGLSKYQSVGN